MSWLEIVILEGLIIRIQKNDSADVASVLTGKVHTFITPSTD